MSTRLEIDVWSDIACPWCYVGRARLAVALERFDADVVVRRRSFELDPAAPRERDPGRPYAERLARKYATTLAQAETMIRTMTTAGAADGLELRFDRVRPGNTFDAHRLLHLSAEHELDAALEERFFRAYLTDGEPIGDPPALARLAAEVGLAPDDVSAVLAGDRFAGAVRADEAEARRRGIHGVPFFLIAGRYGLSGAQPPDVLLRALQSAAMPA
jgi:predicted DsbA family dithiol-disulfide isomerase